MNQCLNIEQIMLDLLKQKIIYFLYFAYAANLKEKNKQFKTEKWLQAEFLVYLQSHWKHGFNVIPEYKNRKWDLYIRFDDNKQKDCYVALKNLADSSENAKAQDKKDIEKDLESVIDHKCNDGRACLIIILPYGRNEKYLADILCYVKNYIHVNDVNSELVFNNNNRPLLFPNSQNEGIQMIFIEKNCS